MRLWSRVTMRRLAVVPGVCVFVACASAPVAPPAFVPADRDALDVVRDGGDTVSSLRATFVARVERGDQSERARGVLLVSKPQRFRLRLSSLFGFTILDYISDAGDDRLWLAAADRILAGDEISRAGLFSSDSARWIFLRERGLLSGGCREVAGETETVVECRAGGTVSYRGYVDNHSRLLTREVVFADGAPELTIHYRDHRATQGVRLPYGIEWIEEAKGTRVEIEIDRYEVNPVLSAAVFAPLQP